MTAQGGVYDELRERLRATQEAAERFAREVPPQGWAAHGDDHQPNADEIEALLQALRSLRELLPDELQEQLRETIRHVLLLVRGILDLALERLDTAELPAPQKPVSGAPEASDIPIL